MFLNMTGETCTGTGDVLTLTGALAGHNAVGKTGNAEDGGAYYFVVADADGVTKVAGVYTFDKTANTLTRNDSWNSTASAVDKNPSSNIALSAGTHTIICAPLRGSQSLPFRGSNSISPKVNSGYLGTGHNDGTVNNSSITVNRLLMGQEIIEKDTVIHNLAIYCSTAGAAGAKARLSIWRLTDVSTIKGLVCESDVLDMTTTGYKKSTLASPIELPAGIYRFGYIHNDGAIRTYQHNKTKGSVGFCPSEMNQSYVYQGLYKSNVTGWETASHDTLGIEGYTATLQGNYGYPVIMYNFN